MKRIFVAIEENGYNGDVADMTVVVTSDNGAPQKPIGSNGGSNWPLRGYKGGLFDGALRVPAFVYR